MLQITPNGLVFIPGCEPESDVTSPSLRRFRRCCSAAVKVEDVLAAIPGTKIVFGINEGATNGVRSRYLVFPSHEQQVCPCVPTPDYYAMLKVLACVDTETELTLPGCEPIDMGYCLPKAAPVVKPAVDHYVEEGTLKWGMTSSDLWPYKMLVDQTVVE